MRHAVLLIVLLVALPLACGWADGAEPWLAPALADADEIETELESAGALSATRQRASPSAMHATSLPPTRPPPRPLRGRRAAAPVVPALTASPLRC